MSGSADCERGMREGCSAVTGIEGGGSTDWSMEGEAVPLTGVCERAKREGGGEGGVDCAIEPLSEASISITDLAEAEVDAVSSRTGEGSPTESSSEGDGPVSCVKLSSRNS